MAEHGREFTWGDGVAEVRDALHGRNGRANDFED